MSVTTPTSSNVARLLFATLIGCGGQTRAYFDDAGVYHAADGAAVFTPGSACIGWDAAALNEPAPACSTFSDPVCQAYGEAVAPPASPINVAVCNGVNDAGEVCRLQYNVDEYIAAACPSVDSAGDTFCEAWASQFFLHGEHAPLSCLSTSIGLRCFPAHDDCVAPDSTSGLTVIWPDGGVGCEMPCTP